MMIRALVGVLIGATLCLAAPAVNAQMAARRHVTRENAAGGVTSGGGGFASGANGGAFAGHHGFATDGQGNAAGGSAEAFRGPNGAEGARAGRWSRSADGSVQHESGGSVSGSRGSATTHGSMSTDGNGNTAASRDTTATSSSGATYQGQTSYEQGSGLSHTGTCTNAEGAVVPCR